MARDMARIGSVLVAVLALLTGGVVAAGKLLRANAPEIAFIRQADGEQALRDIYLLDVERRYAIPMLKDVGASDLAWSPDGEWLAFVGLANAASSIYLIPASGGEARQLTTADTFSPFDLVWSPDGTHLAFVGRANGNTEIYTLDIAHAETQRLTSNTVTDEEVSWSPDSETLLFVSDRAGNLEMYTVSASGGTPHRLAQHIPHDYNPVWSPDGRRIAFTAAAGAWLEVFTLELGSGSVAQLTASTWHKYLPRWSPDGTQLAFLIEDLDESLYKIGVIDVNGGVQILMFPGSVRRFDWSYDGQWLVFDSTIRRGSEIDYDLYIARADGSQIQQVTAGTTDDVFPVWRP